MTSKPFQSKQITAGQCPIDGYMCRQLGNQTNATHRPPPTFIQNARAPIANTA